VTRFDTIAIVDWSAGKRSPKRPSKDSIWIGVSYGDRGDTQFYFRTRIEAEHWITQFIRSEAEAGRRLLLGFDFPFGYPKGVARAVTGSDDPIALWQWLESRIRDDDSGLNNRFDVAEELNRCFDGSGPFWGKPFEDKWPDVPYRKLGIAYDTVPERRSADLRAKAASSRRPQARQNSRCAGVAAPKGPTRRWPTRPDAPNDLPPGSRPLRRLRPEYPASARTIPPTPAAPAPAPAAEPVRDRGLPGVQP
jgi:hypothetical protein